LSINASEEVMLVNCGLAIEAIRPKNEIQGLQDRCLSGIVVADKNAMLGK